VIKAVVDSHNSTDYIISVPNLVSESAFLQRAAVRPNSYAWRLAIRVYRDIFIKSLDIKRDYDLYYKVEYPEFSKYLRSRHLLRRDETEDIARVYGTSAAMFRYKHPLSFVESGYGETLLKTLLKTEVDE
jgi:hypothetical protein